MRLLPDNATVAVNAYGQDYTFTFNRVFGPSSTQQQVGIDDGGGDPARVCMCVCVKGGMRGGCASARTGTHVTHTCARTNTFMHTVLRLVSQVYAEVNELVQSALDGYHVCLMSYGQTG